MILRQGATFLINQMVKDLSATLETKVWSLGREDRILERPKWMWGEVQGQREQKGGDAVGRAGGGPAESRRHLFISLSSPPLSHGLTHTVKGLVMETQQAFS